MTKELYGPTEIADLDAAIVFDPTTGEIVDTPESLAIADRIRAEIAVDLQGKLDWIARSIRNAEANAKACEEEAERFSTRARIETNRAERAKEWLAFAMFSAGLTKVKSERNTASLCGNGGKVPVDVFESADVMPDRFVKVTRVADKEALRAALNAGDAEARKYATLMERGTHLRLT